MYRFCGHNGSVLPVVQLEESITRIECPAPYGLRVFVLRDATCGKVW